MAWEVSLSRGDLVRVQWPGREQKPLRKAVDDRIRRTGERAAQVAHIEPGHGEPAIDRPQYAARQAGRGVTNTSGALCRIAGAPSSARRRGT